MILLIRRVLKKKSVLFILPKELFCLFAFKNFHSTPKYLLYSSFNYVLKCSLQYIGYSVH